jgi:hypothetical protein
MAKGFHMAKGKKRTTKDNWSISVVHGDTTLAVAEKVRDLPRGSHAIAGTLADSKGNVLFARSEEVSQSRFESGFSKCLALAKSAIDQASTLSKDFEIDTMTLKLSVNAKYGCSLLADAKLAGALELKIKRTRGSK